MTAGDADGPLAAGERDRRLLELVERLRSAPGAGEAATSLYWDYREGVADRRRVLTHPLVVSAMREDAARLRASLNGDPAARATLARAVDAAVTADPELRSALADLAAPAATAGPTEPTGRTPEPGR